MFKMEVQYIARLRERKRLLGLMALRKDAETEVLKLMCVLLPALLKLSCS
jgi:hypothetical protein